MSPKSLQNLSKISLRSLMVEYMPSFLMGLLARPYIGGYSLQDSLERALGVYRQKHILSTIDILGEEAHSKEKALSNGDLYLRMLKAIAQTEEYPPEDRPSVSIKLSSLTKVENSEDGARVELDRNILKTNLWPLLEFGEKNSLRTTIDMEDHRWTDLTLEIYRQCLQEGFHHVGTVLQSRLHRTEKDIEELPENSRIRLCIGIYQEPTEIALTEKTAMKERLLTGGKRLLERGIFTELATHDRRVIENFLQKVYSPSRDRGRMEIQMLLGVPRDGIQQELIRGKDGVGPLPVRVYVPFAENKKDGLAYCKRRLMANPSLVTYGMGNFFGNFFGKKIW